MKLLENWSYVETLQVAYEIELEHIGESIRAILEEKGYVGRYALFRHGTVNLQLVDVSNGKTANLIADGFEGMNTSEIEVECAQQKICHFHQLRWSYAYHFIEVAF